MNVDDYTQPVEAVIAQERAFVFPVPLKAESYRELFNEWLPGQSQGGCMRSN